MLTRTLKMVAMRRCLNGRLTHVLLVLSLAFNAYLMFITSIPSNENVASTSDAPPFQVITVKKPREVVIKMANVTQKPTPKPDVFCSLTSRWTSGLIKSRKKANFKKWSFKERVPCPQITVEKRPSRRQRVSLDCKSGPRMFVTWTNASSDVMTVKFGDRCLERVIDSCCKDKYPVPNVVHYIWYSKKELGFFNFLSFMSALRFMKPCLFLLHGDYLPYGKYWNFFISMSPNVVHVLRERPTTVFGHKLAFKEHASDVMRIEALKQYGGVYLDFDEVILRPLEPLRKYEYTQGRELPTTMGSQLVMAKKNATFLNYWYLSYRDDYKNTWAWNALWVPDHLASKHPDLIHIEGYNFTRPNWKNVKQIFEQNYNWSTNYGMHLYVRWYNATTDVDVVRRLNTTIGAVSRHILYGNKELCRH